MNSLCRLAALAVSLAFLGSWDGAIIDVARSRGRGGEPLPSPGGTLLRLACGPEASAPRAPLRFDIRSFALDESESDSSIVR